MQSNRPLSFIFVLSLVLAGLVAPQLAHAAGTWTSAGDLATTRSNFTATLLHNGKVLAAGGAYGSGYLASAEVYDPGTNTWSATGSLAAQRSFHTATLLPSGKVLVAGGYIDTVALASAELYDPGTNTWSAAGSLATARLSHTATLLESGKVLVAGGGYWSAGVYLPIASAELYDPATNTWSAAGSLTTARSGHTATLLPGGKVLIAGGDNESVYLASAEIYDPGTNTWSAAGSLTTVRSRHTATLLPSRKVLVCGAAGGATSAELYDPGTNTWGVAGSLATAREAHSATLLPSGKVLVAGGSNGSGYLVSAEIYDPGTNTWSTTSGLSNARARHTATLLPDGNLLVAGGRTSVNPLFLSSCELFDYAAGSGSWSATGSMATAQANHTATLLANGNVLAAGGGNSGYVASAEIYDAGTNTWSATGSLATARTYHTATLLPNGCALVIGGYNSGGSTASVELYDPGTKTWRAMASLGTPRSQHTATLLPNGKVFVAAGSSGPSLASAELYDPATNAWSAAGSLATARYWHTATLLPSGKVLVAGGNGSSITDNLASAELYDPATNTWIATGSLATARWLHTATLLPSGKVLVVGGFVGGWDGSATTSAELYDPGTNMWSAAGSLAFGRRAPTASLLPNGKVLVAGGYNGTSYPADAELYDPATNTWSPAGSLATARETHTATLLPSGKVLVAGGYNSNGGFMASCELFNPGYGYQNSWRPVIKSVTSPLGNGQKLVVNGSGFKGISEASGGGYQSSATNYPLVQLRSLVNDQTAFLPVDPASGWYETRFTSAPVSGFPNGLATATVFVNGIPSESKTLEITSRPVIDSISPFAGPPAGGTSVTIRGYDFTGATGVTFGGVAATAVTVVNDNQITCTTPTHAAGFVDVSVTTPTGTGTRTNGFFYDGSTWRTAGGLATARYDHTATLLQNGKVLFAGGSPDNGSTFLASAEIYDTRTNTWSAVASLATARFGHTATLLPSGKVLVAGGANNSGNLTSAELYDPAANTWSAAGSMATRREHHTAALLANGTVLVVGGRDANALASAELYDPGTNTWSAAGSLATARVHHCAILLSSGKLMVVGGEEPSVAVYSSVELYDPGSNAWSSAASLATARTGHTATLLPTGNVLVAGGANGSGYLASTELYDPVANTWSAAGSLASPRTVHTATLLPSGKVVVAGGQNTNSQTCLASSEQYDPVTNTWSATASLATARQNHTATLLPSGNVLVAGGCNFNGSSWVFLASAELFDYTAAGNWSAAGSMASARGGQSATLLPNDKLLVAGGYNGSYPLGVVLYDSGTNTWSAAGSLTTGREGPTATLLPNGKVLVAAGWNGSYLASAELYDPGTNTWSAAGSLATTRANHTATLLPNGKVLVAGGHHGSYIVGAELYDPSTNTWSAAGSLATGRKSPAATLLPDGKVLVAGGENGSGVLASAELYDPGTNTWSAAGSLVTARFGPTATLLPNGKVLAVGGWNGDSLASAELYDPATNTWSAAASLATARSDHDATLLPNGKVLVAAGWYANGYNATASAELYDPQTNTWSAAGSLATARGAFTTTLLASGKVLVAGGAATGNVALSSAELFDPGQAINDSWRPVINTLPATLTLGTKLTVGGSLFKGISDASGGGYQSSATNYPLVQVRSLVNDQTAFLLADPSSSWSDTSFTSAAVTGFPLGQAQVTVFTNGIASVSRMLEVREQVATPTFNPVAGSYTGAQSVTISCATSGASIYYTTDGSTPTTSSAQYTGAINITATKTVQALAVKSGMTDSTVASATYTINISPANHAPTISTAAAASPNPAELNQSVSFSVSASDVDSDALTYSWDFGDGASASGASPSHAYAATGTYSAVVTVSDGKGGTASSSVSVTIKQSPPAITSATSASGTIGIAFSYTITASNSPTSFGVIDPPNGLSLDTASGKITGTPTAAGKTNVTISATNAAGTGSATLVLTISSQAPSITSTLNATATVGQGFSYEITASGTSPMTYEAAPLPDGLSLSGAIVSGTPKNDGTVNINLKATNSAGNDSKTLSLTINPVGAPAITSPLLATGTVGMSFSYTIAANGNTPMDFSANGLPAGLVISGATISGTPSGVGKTDVSISAKNSVGTDSKILTITINAVGAPSITSSLSKNARVDQSFDYTITADGTGPITFGATPLPGWLTFTAATAKLSGTPKSGDVGTIKITLTASNDKGTDSKELLLTVAPSVTDPPVVTDIYRSRNPVRTNTDVSFTADAVSPSGQPLSYTWFFFDSANKQDGPPMAGQTVTRSFPAEGKYTVVAIAFDGFSKSTNFTKVSVTLAPNSGSEDKNAATGMIVVNPLNGLGLKIPDSLGGVIDLDLVDEAVGKSREEETFMTRVATGQDSYDGRAVAGKYSNPSIFVVESTGTTISGKTRKARFMVPIGKRETEAGAPSDTRTKKGAVSFQVTGKFNFGKKVDGVTLATEIELPAGMKVNGNQDISVGIGNVVADAVVDAKGRVSGLSSGFKRVQIKFPKVDKTTGQTKAGDKAKVTITLQGSNLHTAGFETEGITNKGMTEKLALPRKIQVALVIGGVSYFESVDTKYTYAKSTGVLTGRSGK